MVHHRAVHVSLSVVLKPPDWRVQSQMTTLTSWYARPGMLRETSSELLCSVRIQEVDEGKAVTGTMLEVHGDKRDQSS